jgi:hypothetical protein
LKKPLVVDPRALLKLADLPRASRDLCQDAIFSLVEAFGRPHVHQGLGIRKLKPGLFECRAGLDLRILFRDEPACLRILLVGNHDDVQRELRGGKHG